MLKRVQPEVLSEPCRVFLNCVEYFNITREAENTALALEYCLNVNYSILGPDHMFFSANF